MFDFDLNFQSEMDTTDAPQILEHASQSLGFTPFDVKWIPSSARFCLFGQSPSAKGVFNVYSLEDGTLKLITEWKKEYGIKSGTFKASPVSIRDPGLQRQANHLRY
jgi:hypothetical protein